MRNAACFVAVAVATVAGCSHSSRDPGTEPPLSGVPAATIAGYARTVCGGLRAVRTLADRLHDLSPQLSGDAGSRTLLKAQLLADLDVASKAAALGARFVAKADTRHIEALDQHRAAVVAALDAAAADYARWRKLATAFPTFDRDNWEIALLSTEGGKIRAGGWAAWQQIDRSVRAGAVGAALRSATATEPSCRTVLR